jgi:hypothetical protein
MRSLRLKNFRSLIDTGRIELRPLTLLVGANNSGKSSFLRFFPLLRQTYEARSASPLLWYGRDVDFADFSHVVRRGADPIEIEIDLEIDLALVFDGHAVKRGPPILTQFAITLQQCDEKTQLRRCVVTRDDQSYDLMLDRAQELEWLTANGVDVLSQAPGWRPQVSTSQLIPNFNPESEPLEGLPPPGSWLGRALQGGARNGTPLDDRLKPVGAVPDILWWSGQDLAHYARGVAYISPFRAPPQRLYRVQEVSVDRVHPHGENLAMFLRALPPAQIDAFAAFMAEHMGLRPRLETAASTVSILLENESGQADNLVDMGGGLSQVLPVVAQCWLAASGWRGSERGSLPSLIAIEEPEQALHPAYQAKLADMFNGVLRATRATHDGAAPRLLIETHSEALVNRLGELVEAGELASEDVSVLLFEQDPVTKATTVRQSTYTPDGALANWPIGFFAP